jgi:hypothetical protein
MRRRNFLLTVAIVSVLLLPNCGGGSPPPPVTVAVSPVSQKVAVSGSVVFSATVTNTTNLAVTWQVNGTTGGNGATTGSISPNGVYTAPANVPNPATVTVTAVSQADSTKSGSASVTVTVAVSVTPPQATLNLNATQQFAASVNGISNQAVTWQVNGVLNGNPTLGTISDTGLYTAPSAIPSPSTVSVNAVSQADPTQSGNAAVMIGEVTINQQQEAAPIELGTSGGNENDISAKFCCSGTLGSLVVRAGTFYILSNNHVLARSGQATLGEKIGQPGLVDTTPAACSPSLETHVADLSQFAPLQNNGVDAAIAQIVAGEVDTTGAILQLGAVVGGVPQPAPPANTVATAAVNMPIAKSGRSTGLSCGTVQLTNVSVQVDYSTSCGGATTSTITYTNQVMSSANFAGNGDSGSLIVDATTAQPVALLYAGDNTGAAVGNPIQQVLDAFKSGTNAATMVGAAQHQVSGCTGMEPQPVPLSASVERQLFQAAVPAAIAVKERHEAELMSDPAVLAIGIGDSGTAGHPAIVVDIERGKPHRTIPAVLEGIPTRVITTGRFKANDWDPNAVKRCSSTGKSSHDAILPMK